MSDLKPCPFCGGALVWSDTYREYHHPVAKCILSGYKFKKGVIGQWNHRDALNTGTGDQEAVVGNRTVGGGRVDWGDKPVAAQTGKESSK